MKNYKKRLVDSILSDKLESKGAVVIEGAKGCGKTTTALKAAKSDLRMDDPVKRIVNKQMSEIDPGMLLKGAHPRLIDEWPIAPNLFDSVRAALSEDDRTGQFILAGSKSIYDTDEVSDFGAGCFTYMTMYPMSLYESGISTGDVSLENLFDSPNTVSGVNPLDVYDISFYMAKGGWPAVLDKKDKPALTYAADYYDSLIKFDISKADGVKKNHERVKKFMKALARNQGTAITTTALRQDIISNENETLNEDTVAAYINALKKIYVAGDIPAFIPNLKTTTPVRTSDARYFVDPSIAVAALGMKPDDLLYDINLYSSIFKTLCIRDLKVYASTMDGEILHYRDKTNLSVDAVVSLKNGKYGLIEIKLGGQSLIDEGAKNLKTLTEKIDTEKMPAPSFLMILVGTGDYAYKRQDGIYIVPIGCLKN